MNPHQTILRKPCTGRIHYPIYYFFARQPPTHTCTASLSHWIFIQKKTTLLKRGVLGCSYAWQIDFSDSIPVVDLASFFTDDGKGGIAGATDGPRPCARACQTRLLPHRQPRHAGRAHGARTGAVSRVFRSSVEHNPARPLASSPLPAT